MKRWWILALALALGACAGESPIEEKEWEPLRIDGPAAQNPDETWEQRLFRTALGSVIDDWSQTTRDEACWVFAEIGTAEASFLVADGLDTSHGIEWDPDIAEQMFDEFEEENC